MFIVCLMVSEKIEGIRREQVVYLIDWFLKDESTNSFVGNWNHLA